MVPVTQARRASPSSHNIEATGEEQRMQYLRIYAGPDGESHLEDVEVPGNPVGDAIQSDPFAATALIFRHSPKAVFHDWHNAPRRQFVIHLRGDVEIQTSDGELR